MLPLEMLNKTGFRIVQQEGQSEGEMLLQVRSTYKPAGEGDSCPVVRIEADVPLSNDLLEDCVANIQRVEFYLPQIIGTIETSTGVHYGDNTVKALAVFIGMTIAYELKRRRALKPAAPAGTSPAA